MNWHLPDGSLSDGQDYDETESEEERIRFLVEYTITQTPRYKGGHIPRGGPEDDGGEASDPTHRRPSS